MSDEMLLTALAWSIVQVVRAMPALVWSIRCRSSSNAYRCPPVFPTLLKRRRESDAGSAAPGSSGGSVQRAAK